MIPSVLLSITLANKPIANLPRQNGQTLVLSSMDSAHAFAREFGSTVYHKRVPEWILGAPAELLVEFIRGMWLGAGTYDARENMFSYNYHQCQSGLFLPRFVTAPGHCSLGQLAETVGTAT